MFANTVVRVFAQALTPSVDLVKLLSSARAYFDFEIEVLGEELEPAGHAARVRLAVSSARHGFRGEFEVRVRATTEADQEGARAAEWRGRAAGMADLAQRCAHTWEVIAIGASPETARLSLCAVLASVALGPVLPDDESTLFGVRGALQRRDALLREPAAPS